MKTVALLGVCLLATIGGSSSASLRTFQCFCNTEQCKEQNITRCESVAMCYTQYLKKRDGSDPITRGCLHTKTSLLCENRRPAVANWPILVCCKNNMCNEGLAPQIAALMGNVTVPVSGVTTSTEATAEGSDVLAEDPDPQEAPDQPSFRPKEFLEEGNTIYSNHRLFESQPVRPIYEDRGLTSFHMAVLVSAITCLCLLFCLGFAILRRQSRLFSAAYIAPNNYIKEQNLTSHEHHCGQVVTPTRAVYDNHILSQA